MDKQVVIVTGGSRGIGRGICVEFAKNNYDVVINYSGNEAKANETKALCEEAGAKTLVCRANVSDSCEVSNMFNKVIKEFGHIDVLVNNAGITKDMLIMKMKEEEFDDVIDVNLKGTFLCTKQVIRPMMRQRFGRIINLSSVVGIHGNAGQINYAASKAGIIGITKSLAKEIGSRNITCNAIAPGLIETDMTNNLTDEYKAAIAENISLKRLGSIEDVSKLALFLASPDASYITGQVIAVDGGMQL